MKLLKVAAIAAIVFSGSALAGVVPQYGGGGGNHGGGGNNSGPNSELNIYQYGGGNSALALQADARNSDLTITMVAGKVGFGSYSHFTEQFKKFYGMTPREFQNEGRKER